MKKIILISLCTFAFAANLFAQDCTIGQVMKTVHTHKANFKYEYASDFDGQQGPPTLKRHATNDQYLFWVDDNGQTFPAIVTYATGECENVTSVIKIHDGE